MSLDLPIRSVAGLICESSRLTTKNSNSVIRNIVECIRVYCYEMKKNKEEKNWSKNMFLNAPTIGDGVTRSGNLTRRNHVWATSKRGGGYVSGVSVAHEAI